MKICKIKYSENYDETKIIFDEDFYCADRILKLDVLKDAIAILEQKYNNILINQYIK
jgi:hypothetical protein